MIDADMKVMSKTFMIIIMMMMMMMMCIVTL